MCFLKVAEKYDRARCQSLILLTDADHKKALVDLKRCLHRSELQGKMFQASVEQLKDIYPMLWSSAPGGGAKAAGRH